jgi:ADP-heptose:LPS heptosyltransferase
MKILILRFSSIGDIVLTTPVPRTIKTQLHCEVHFCTKIQYAGILENNPYIDKVHVLKDDLSQLIKVLKQEKYDYIIDLHHNLRTLVIKKRLGVKSFSFKKLNLEKWLLVNLKINKMPNIHIVERYMDTLKPLGIKMDNLGLDFFIPEKDIVAKNWLPESHQNSYIAFVVGATYATKRLPLKKMIQLCHQISKPIVLLGGKEDFEIGEQVREFFSDQSGEAFLTPEIFNGCGKFNLNQSASLIKQAKYVFTHDTGLMHIAAAFKKEIFCIWGNTTPAFGMYPYRTKFTVFENNQLNCRPCSKIGYSKCPRKHFKCMNDLKFDFYLPDFDKNSKGLW